MKRILNYLVILVISIYSFTACDFLNVDEHFNDLVSIDSIFTDKEYLQDYLFSSVNLFPDAGAIWGNTYTPGVTATDEAFVQWDQTEYMGMQFALGRVTPDNLGSMDIYPDMYKIVRKVNTVLSRMDECKELTNLDRREIIGYAKFIRAYAYYRLLENFGPLVVLEDEVLETNKEPEYYDKERWTFDETCDYVCSEFEESATYLPAIMPINQFERPTRGAAYAFVSRIRMYQASSLFNGGAASRKYFGNWKRKSDGKFYVSQEYDETKWAIASHAAKRVIETGRYSLYTVPRTSETLELPGNVPADNFPDGAGDIDPYKSYKDIFSGEAIYFKNDEIIWGKRGGKVTAYTKHSFPVNLLGGWNGMAVPQKIIDAYRMADGRDIYNSSVEYPYSEEGFTTGITNFSGYQLNAGVSNMYVNREMRFYASIGFSECFWPCRSTSENNKKNKTVTYYIDGTAGKWNTNSDIRNYPITGYVIKKFIHNDDAWSGRDAERIVKTFPVIRYAEILLNFAEANAHLTGTHQITDHLGTNISVSKDVSAIQRAFNQVRYRAGLPGITPGEIDNNSESQELVERERMIEFLHENRRYYDVRRWGIIAETEAEPIMGMDTGKRKNEGYYNRVIVDHPFVRNRIWDDKMIFLPISRSEIRKAPKIDQNPGWDF